MVWTMFRHMKKRTQETDVGKDLKIQLSSVNQERLCYDYGGDKVLEDFCVNTQKMEPIRELFIQLFLFFSQLEMCFLNYLWPQMLHREQIQ